MQQILTFEKLEQDKTLIVKIVQQNSPPPPFCLHFFLILHIGGLWKCSVCWDCFVDETLRENCCLLLYIELQYNSMYRHKSTDFVLFIVRFLFVLIFLGQNVPAAILSSLKDRRRLLYLLFTLTFNRRIGSEHQKSALPCRLRNHLKVVDC